ncbi:MAG: hypothetical protein KGS48_11495 [Bacteroidetes bacterium]|nr:hypothetical protein [Bacteroidota bacterium]
MTGKLRNCFKTSEMLKGKSFNAMLHLFFRQQDMAIPSKISLAWRQNLYLSSIPEVLKQFLSLLLPFVLLVFSCKQTSDLPLSCEEQFVLDHNLIKYTGQDLATGCKFYFSLYELDGKEYFCEDNPCTDMISIPLDCNGQVYCTSTEDPQLSYFYRNAQWKHIVGLRP